MNNKVHQLEARIVIFDFIPFRIFFNRNSFFKCGTLYTFFPLPFVSTCFPGDIQYIYFIIFYFLCSHFVHIIYLLLFRKLKLNALGFDWRSNISCCIYYLCPHLSRPFILSFAMSTLSHPPITPSSLPCSFFSQHLPHP